MRLRGICCRSEPFLTNTKVWGRERVALFSQLHNEQTTVRRPLSENLATAVKLCHNSQKKGKRLRGLALPSLVS